MEPILSKEEITDLLSAIKSGAVSTDAVDDGSLQSPRLLSALDVDLFQAYDRKIASGELRIPNYDLIIDRFSRSLASSLSNNLQRSFSVIQESISTTDFQQSLSDLHNQGAIGIYTTLPLKHGCLIHFDTMLSFSMLEIMLGSSVANESLALERDLTTIEVNILKNVMTEISTDLEKAFRPVQAFQPQLNKVENNFRLVNIVENYTEVIVSRFSIRISGEPAGQIQFIIPYPTLEPIREKFKELVTVSQSTHTWGKQLSSEVLEMESDVVARSGLVNLNIREILQLQAGDIIDLNYDPDQPLTIVVEGQPKFFAVPGERNSKKAFHVTGRYSTRRGEFHGST